MPVKRRIAKVRRQREISPEIWAWLNDTPKAEDNPEIAFQVLYLEAWPEELSRLWTAAREELLARWILDHPGTRPRLWWRFDAPRQPRGKFQGCFYDGRLEAPRRVLGGAGRPAHEVSAYVPSYRHGIPLAWADLDEADPPRFESQATYLERHGLLTAAERKFLRPSDFEAEVCLSFGSIYETEAASAT